MILTALILFDFLLQVQFDYLMIGEIVEHYIKCLMIEEFFRSYISFATAEWQVTASFSLSGHYENDLLSGL